MFNKKHSHPYFVINYPFSVVVYPSALNKIVNKATTFQFIPNQVVDESVYLPYKILSAMDTGKLLPKEEWEAYTEIKILSQETNEPIGQAFVQFSGFHQLEGDNDFEFPFLEVHQ